MKAFTKKILALNTQLIQVDETYQRRIRQNEIKGILKNFNPNVVNMPKVSYRDGKYYVFDGQHTIVALVAKNDNLPLVVDCIVFYGMTQKDEKELFKLQNGNSSKPTALDLFRADYNCAEPYAVYIVGLLQRYGIEICTNNSKGDGKLVCISTVIKEYKTLTADEFSSLFKIVSSAWNLKEESLDNRIISGIGKFVKSYHKTQYNQSDLVKKLSKRDPNELISLKTDTAIARSIVDMYNKGRKPENRLPMVL